jgi:phenylacetate-CoA ligase
MNSLNFFGIPRLRLLDFFCGMHIRRFHKELKAQQYYPSEKLYQMISDKFHRLYKKATSGTQYYHYAKQYNKMEVLTREKVANNFDNLISKNYRKKLYLKSTAGPEQKPFNYLTTEEAQSNLWAGLILSWEVAGYQPGDRVAIVAGAPELIKNFKQIMFQKLLNIDTYDSSHIREEDIPAYLIRLKQSRVKIIYGYESALNTMANYINKNGPYYSPFLKGIISSSKAFSEANRTNIEKAFHVNVYNQYGCDEAGLSAFECENHQLHLIGTGCKYEVDIDGNLLATDLVNEGFIMMKYFTGDKVEFATDNTCGCNRKSPILKKTAGPDYDFHAASNESFLRSAFFDSIFRKDESIKKMQIYYDTKNISVHLNVDNSHHKDGHYNQYLEEIKKYLRFNQYNLIINTPSTETEDSYESYMISSSQKSNFENNPYYL